MSLTNLMWRIMGIEKMARMTMPTTERITISVTGVFFDAWQHRLVEVWEEERLVPLEPVPPVTECSPES